MSTMKAARPAAVALCVAVWTVLFAASGRADWSTDSSCAPTSAPSRLNDYVDWWQGCSSTSARGGPPTWSPSPPACAPRRWTSADGACVALSCVAGQPRQARIAPCARPGVSPSTAPRVDAVRLDADGCHVVIERTDGARDVYAVAPERVACSTVVRYLGLPMPPDGFTRREAPQAR